MSKSNDLFSIPWKPRIHPYSIHALLCRLQFLRLTQSLLSILRICPYCHIFKRFFAFWRYYRSRPFLIDIPSHHSRSVRLISLLGVFIPLWDIGWIISSPVAMGPGSTFLLLLASSTTAPPWQPPRFRGHSAYVQTPHVHPASPVLFRGSSSRLMLVAMYLFDRISPLAGTLG